MDRISEIPNIVQWIIVTFMVTMGAVTFIYFFFRVWLKIFDCVNSYYEWLDSLFGAWWKAGKNNEDE